MQTVFFDQVVAVRFSEGVARFEVGAFIGEKEDGKRVVGEIGHVFCSVAGLLQLKDQIDALVTALVEKKVLKKSDDKKS